MKIKPLFIPLKNVTRITHTHTESVHNGQLHRMNTYQVWQNAGMRQKVYAREDLDTVYSQAEEFWSTIEQKLISSVVAVDPTYVPRPDTMASAGDKYSAIRHDLRMAIRGLFKAYATRNWEWVSTYSVHVNRHYIRHFRAVCGDTVMYYNHDNIACGDVFMEPSERTLFGRRKKPVSK